MKDGDFITSVPFGADNAILPYFFREHFLGYHLKIVDHEKVFTNGQGKQALHPSFSRHIGNHSNQMTAKPFSLTVFSDNKGADFLKASAIIIKRDTSKDIVPMHRHGKIMNMLADIRFASRQDNPGSGKRVKKSADARSIRNSSLPDDDVTGSLCHCRRHSS